MGLYGDRGRDLLDEYTVSAKLLKETRLFLEKEYGREFSDQEVREVALLIKKLSMMALDQVLDKADWDEKLKTFPKGYEFTEKGYTCWLCGGSAHGGKCGMISMGSSVCPASGRWKPGWYRARLWEIRTVIILNLIWTIILS